MTKGIGLDGFFAERDKRNIVKLSSYDFPIDMELSLMNIQQRFNSVGEYKSERDEGSNAQKRA